MSEQTENSPIPEGSQDTSLVKGISRRAIITNTAAAVLGGGIAILLGEKRDTACQTTKTNDTGKDIALLSSESRRGELPAYVKQAVFVSNERLIELVRGDNFIGSLVDTPTDWVTLYLEKLNNTGKPIPPEIREELRAILIEVSGQFGQILGRLNK